ncbi:MAG: dihydropteroate synthase [Sulfuricaulis sp.]
MIVLDCGGRLLDLSAPAVMGILNVTPDSFSDGGVFLSIEMAVAHALQMAQEGADIIDIGGESTRPGAAPVSAQQEIDRVIPVIEALRGRISQPISIDTSKSDVMRAAVMAGAGFINDVRALREEGALATAAALHVPVCLMHMQGEPRVMQDGPRYQDVVAEVTAFLRARMQAAQAAGIPAERLVVDPGFGFGKTLAHNLELLRGLQQLKGLGATILAGLSRKSMIGKALGLPIERRLYASVALAVIAVQNGAKIIRVHDVGPTVEALRMWSAVYPEYAREQQR